MLRAELVRNHFADPEWEGEIAHLYLDSRDNVTVGIGCLLRSVTEAQALGFVYREDQLERVGATARVVHRKGEEAADEAIAVDYQAVTAQAGAGWAAQSFRKVTKLDLPRKEVDRIFFERVQQFEAQLRLHLPDYDKYPAHAQLALLDMAFNLGTAGLVSGFPKLVQAAKARTWEVAADECHRQHIPERRNHRTAELFRLAAKDEKARQAEERKKLRPRSVETLPPAPEWLKPLLDAIRDTLEKVRPLIRPRIQGGK